MRKKMKKEICDLPENLVGERILTRVPITDLRAVRSTCKSWNALTKYLVLGEARARHEQFVGFIMMNYKMHSVRFDFRKKNADLSIKPIDLFGQLEITKILLCDGLVLLVVKDESRLVVWNPYLGQTQSILPRTNFHRLDRYAFGHDINRNHKILRFVDSYVHGRVFAFEIYDFSSSSWRVLEGGPGCVLEAHQRSVSVKGNAYFCGHEDFMESFLLCFDFTTESFGPRLPLPFDSNSSRGDETVSLSCLPEDRLAVFYFQNWKSKTETVEIWVTTKIDPNSVSWSKFFKVDVKPLTQMGVHFVGEAGSFFIDEQEKVVVVFDINSYLFPPVYNTAFFLKEDGYFKVVRLGKARNIATPNIYGQVGHVYSSPLLSSSPYSPSLVQVEQA